jgi:hypothetical protein
MPRLLWCKAIVSIGVASINGVFSALRRAARFSFKFLPRPVLFQPPKDRLPGFAVEKTFRGVEFNRSLWNGTS